MFEIIIANFGVWFNLAIPIVIALYLALTHKEYIWNEFGIQVAATFVYVGIVYTLLFSFTTDLKDTEYWNGKVNNFEYYEEWTELVTYTESYECGSSKNPRTCTRTKTRHDHHSPYWKINTSNGEDYRIDKSGYRTAASTFGNTKVNLHRSNQVSSGDGNKFVSKPNIIIPTSVSHSYDNYVVAAKQNVIHTKVPKEEINLLLKSGKLREYPIQYLGRFGELKLDRVVDTTGTANISGMLAELDIVSNQYGSSKQANPIIYITKEDRSIRYVIEQYWNKAKKNDVVLILGVDDNGVIIWSDAIAWTNNTDFIVDCSNEFSGMNVRVNASEISNKLGDLVQKGYTRKPMKEFSYLKENITLEWHWQLLVFIGNILLSGFIFYKMMNNYGRKRN